jgi:hypothetical protein
MRSKDIVKSELEALRAQLDQATPGSTARAMITERLRSLLWVLGDERVERLSLSQGAMKLYDCLG